MNRKRLKPRASWRRLPPGDVEGYIVMRQDGWTLGHDLGWYPHSALENGYVYTAAELTRGGEWMKMAKCVVPAKYIRETDSTVVTGEEVPFADFVAKHRPPDESAGDEKPKTMAAPFPMADHEGPPIIP